VILPVDDISNAACEAVANNVKGTLAIPHAYGRLQFGEDLDVHFRTMIGTGANPNVAAVVVIGIEPEWTKVIADGIRETGKPVAEFSIEQKGDFETIRAASWAAKEFVHMATEYQREECSISELWVSTKCGESDTTTGLGSCPTVGNMYDKLLPEGITGFFGETSEITGAEHICKERAINEEVGERWYKMWEAYVIHTFPTGQGNVVGNPIVPVIKITANPRTVRTMGEHIDVDVSGILRRDQTIDEAGDALIEMIRRTANGRNTAAEALGHREFSMTKLYRSA
jgi:altronate dehydratase